MLAVNDLSYYIGGRALYENASLHIKPKDKIGLIGLNGKGKSTLLKIINKELVIDSGEIGMSKDCTIGFLNQDLLSFQSDESILNVAMMAFKETIDLYNKINQLLIELENNYADELVEKLTQYQEKFEQLEGYSMQAKAGEILEGIGFKTADLNRPLKEFSGGWRMRVMLAKLLLEKPSLLMLDEPTNHLDLPSILWIENYLKNYEGAVIVVSHDREFLNNTVTKIVEVSNAKLQLFEGNYDYYLEEKELQSIIQKNAFENQQSKIKQTEKFIEKFRAKATKARQVQSRIKSLEKMEFIEDVIDENAKVNFKFNFNKKSGRHVIILEDVSKMFQTVTILKDTSATIERGDKIALIGANGKGKSTLLRIIAGTENIEGKINLGHNVNVGFYAQHQLESLNSENEILDELKQTGTLKTEMELRQILGCFLFSNEDVFKKIKVLSGGEKSRVALAKILIQESNFLLLDEPTNHLDFQSENILIQALQQYEGTFITVSHNRNFIAHVANKIWYIENFKIKEYPGNYEEYLHWKATKEENEEKIDNNKVIKTKSPDKKKQFKNKTFSNNSNKNTQREIQQVEIKIEEHETAIEELENQLAKPSVYGNPEELQKINKLYTEKKLSLQQLNNRWEKLIESLEE